MDQPLLDTAATDAGADAGQSASHESEVNLFNDIETYIDKQQGKNTRRLFAEGDRIRRAYNGLFVLLIVGQAVFFTLATKSDWWNIYRTTTTEGGDQQTIPIQELDYKDTREVFQTSDIFILVRIFVGGISKIMPIIRIGFCALAGVIITAGPYRLRTSVLNVAVIRESALELFSSANFSHGTSSGWDKRFNDFIYRQLLATGDWMCLGASWKIVNTYIYMILFLILCMSEEFMVRVGSVTYDHEAEVKSGVFWFWATTFLTLIMSVFAKIQMGRWLRRLNAVDKYAHAATTPDADTVTCANGAEHPQVRDMPVIKRFKCYKKLAAQHKATLWVSLAIFSRVFLIFLPVIRFNYKKYLGDDVQSVSAEYTTSEVLLELISASYKEQSARILQVIFWIDVLTMPTVVLSICAALKILRWHDQHSRFISPMYYSMIYLETFGNVEAFTLAVFLTVWSIKYTMRYMIEEGEMCDFFSLEDGCIEVDADFVSGTWFLLIYAIAQSYAVKIAQIDLAIRLNDMLTIEAYKPILQLQGQEDAE